MRNILILAILVLSQVASAAPRKILLGELRDNATKALLATSTEVGYLSGVTANIQTQINNAGGGSSFNPATSVSLYEDFLKTDNSGNPSWPDITSGAGSAVVQASTGDSPSEMLANHPGLVRLETGTTATGRALTASTDIASPMVLGGGEVSLTLSLKIPVAISAGVEEFSVQAGLFMRYDFDPNFEGAYFEYNPSSANWLCTTSKSGVSTTNDSGIAVTTGAGDTYQALKIVVNAAATSVAFTVNGAAACTNTTNIPSGNNGFGDPLVLSPFFGITKSLGTTERTIFADYAYLTQSLTRQ